MSKQFDYARATDQDLIMYLRNLADETVEAERLLKNAGMKRKRFLVTFRLGNATSQSKGTYKRRYDHLMARIHKLSGEEHHVTTSAWTVQSYRQTSKLILEHLGVAVDERIDVLQVEMTSSPVRIGQKKLADA